MPLPRGLLAARDGAGNLLDLPCDRIQPIMDFGDVFGVLGRHRSGRHRLRHIGDGAAQPVGQRQAGAARGGFRTLAHYGIDAFDTPRGP